MCDVECEGGRLANRSRNQTKRRKFFELHDSLPEHIRNMFAEAKQLGSGRQAKETEIINAVFSKVGGRYHVDLQNPYFKQHCDRSVIKNAEDSEKAVPFCLAVEKFRDGEAGLRRALEANQLKAFKVNGQVYISWRELSTSQLDSFSNTASTSKAFPPRVLMLSLSSSLALRLCLRVCLRLSACLAVRSSASQHTFTCTGAPVACYVVVAQM